MYFGRVHARDMKIESDTYNEEKIKLYMGYT